MSPIWRHDRGRLTVPASTLTDIDWVLDMDTASPRSTVIAALALEDPRDAAPVHEYLSAAQVDTIQRLRGWNRLRHGSITVDAGLLSGVRNTLDSETFHRTQCEDFLDELRDEIGMSSPGQESYAAVLQTEFAAIEPRVENGGVCGRCPWCQALALRDVLDELLDNAGFHGGSRYAAYGADNRPGSAIGFWRNWVTAPTATLAA